MDTNTHICNEKNAWALDNGIRRMLQSPEKIIRRYIRPGMAVADLGCGPGYFTLPIARKVGSEGMVTAVDIQAGMLNKIHNKIKHTSLDNIIVLHQCQMNDLGLKGKYDIIFAFWMVHEVKDPLRLLAQIYQLLEPTGRFILVEPKGHVSQLDFENTVELATDMGFMAIERPNIKFSRALVFKK